MSAVSFLTSWIKYLLIITPFAAGAVVTYEATVKSLSCDEETIRDADKKIRQTIKAAIIIMCMSGFVECIKAFY